MKLSSFYGAFWALVAPTMLDSYNIVYFLKKWANPGLVFVYFWSFQTNNTIFTTNQCAKNVKMSIQYMTPGFELMTFQT